MLTVKDNQPRLSDDILASLVAAQDKDFVGCAYEVYATEARGHGRAEKRSYTVM